MIWIVCGEQWRVGRQAHVKRLLCNPLSHCLCQDGKLCWGP